MYGGGRKDGGITGRRSSDGRYVWSPTVCAASWSTDGAATSFPAVAVAGSVEAGRHDDVVLASHRDAAELTADRMLRCGEHSMVTLPGSGHLEHGLRKLAVQTFKLCELVEVTVVTVDIDRD